MSENPSVAESRVGTTLADTYRLDRVLSYGLTSVVYQGVQVRLGQPVAVKILDSKLSFDGELIERFRHQAQAQARLNHANIVRVFDVISAGSTHAAIMEYVSGRGLDEILDEQEEPLAAHRIVELIRPIVAAVQYAHARGVVHHDLKPSNVLVTAGQAGIDAKVMDFGMAKALANSMAEVDPDLRLERSIYMSPEQCKAHESVDGRTDIYALGIMLYQMSTCMVPFLAESPIDVMLAHIKLDPTPPRELNAQLTEGFEEMILRAIAKSPADRFQSIDDFDAAFEELIADHPLQRTKTLDLYVTPVPGEIDREAVMREIALTEAIGPRAIRTEELTLPEKKDRRVPRQAAQRAVASSSKRSSGNAVRLRVRLASASDWTKHFDANIGGGGVFCPSNETVEVGTPANVEVLFSTGPRVLISGVVTWRRTRSDVRMPAGVGVQVHTGELAKLAYINAWVSGEADDKRRHRRLPIRLRAVYKMGNRRRITFTRDVHTEGLFLRCEELVKEGTTLDVLLSPPLDGKAFALRGTVRRVVSARHERGMGLELKWSDPERQAAFAQLMAELEAKFLSGDLPDAAIS